MTFMPGFCFDNNSPLSHLMDRICGPLFGLAVMLMSATATAEPPGVQRKEIDQMFEKRYGFKYERAYLTDDERPEGKTFENVIRGTSMLIKIALIIMYLTSAWQMRALQKYREQTDAGHGPATMSANYSYPATTGWFFAGAIVTAVFSSSLAMLAENAGLGEVLFVGMLVPSFTWIVQMTASAIGMTRKLLERTGPGRSARVGCFATSGDHQSVLVSGSALDFRGKCSDQCSCHGCDTLSQVNPSRDYSQVANQLGIHHNGEYRFLCVGKPQVVVGMTTDLTASHR